MLYTGGWKGNSHSRYTSFFQARSSNWTAGPTMIQKRASHACSSFWLNGNQILVVSPGVPGMTRTDVEFLNLHQENPQWIEGMYILGSRLRKAGRCRFYHGRTLSH